jgi:hypothetical protein
MLIRIARPVKDSSRSTASPSRSSSPRSCASKSTSPSSCSDLTNSVRPPSSRVPGPPNNLSSISNCKLTYTSRRRHPRPRLRRRTHVPGVRHPPSDCQIHRRLLPEIRRRVLQEPAQAGPRGVRPHTARRRQQTVRAQEVRRARRARAVPEILPLNRAGLRTRRADAWMERCLSWAFSWSMVYGRFSRDSVKGRYIWAADLMRTRSL